MTLFGRANRATVRQVCPRNNFNTYARKRPTRNNDRLIEPFAGLDAELQDIEQVVVRRQLTLGLAVVVPTGRDLVKEVLLFGWEEASRSL